MKKFGSILFVAAIIFYSLFHTEFGEILRQGNINLLVHYMKSLGWVAYIISFVAIILQTFFPFIPFIVLAGANALLFGLWKGFLISWSFAVTGAVFAFYFSRYLAYDFAVKQSSRYPILRKLEDKIKQNGFMIFFLGRLIPILPSSVINFFGGISALSFRTFFWSTMLGKIPIVYLETMMGHDIVFFRQHPKRLIVLVFFFVLLMLIGYFINKKMDNNKMARD